MLQHIVAIISGAIFVLGIIAGIGPQNLNIINHAIKRNHSLEVSTASCLADLSLLLAGGIGLSLSGSKTIILVINVIGIIFMIGYLFVKIKSLFQHHEKFKVIDEHQTKRQAILKALALTFLNPLVFIDTIVLIGGTATHYNGLAWVDFMCGALLGDIIWISGITYIARSFSKQLNKIGVWIALDVMTIGIVSIILYKTIGYVIN